MADEETQGPKNTSRAATDAIPDPPLPTATFDEPLVWPEALDWVQAPATGDTPPLDPAPDVAGGEVPVPASDAEGEPLAGLGGGLADRPSTPTPVPPPPPHELGDLPTLGGAGLAGWPGGDAPSGGDVPPGSIWGHEAVAGNLLVTSSTATPSGSAEPDRNRGGRPWPRLNVRWGNAAVIALISVVSLILLGMFLSVRARNDVPSDAAQPPRQPGTNIAVPPNTFPLTTTVPTTAPPPAINLSDLLPTPVTDGPAGAAGATGSPVAPGPARPSGVDGGIGAGAPGTTAATTRPTTPPAGTGAPATQPPAPPTVTNTQPEPEPQPQPQSQPEPTVPRDPTPPVDDTRPTVTTRPPTPTTQFTIPDITVPSVPSIPTAPTTPRPNALFPGRD